MTTAIELISAARDSIVNVEHQGNTTLDWVIGIAQVAAVVIAAVAVIFAARTASAASRQAAAQTRPVLDAVQRKSDDSFDILLPTGNIREGVPGGEILADHGERWISVPFRNVGPGLAKIVEAHLKVPDAERPARVPKFNRQYVAPGGYTRAGFWYPDGERADRAISKFQGGEADVTVAVTYTDLADDQRQTVCLVIGIRTPLTTYRVLEVSYTEH